MHSCVHTIGGMKMRGPTQDTNTRISYLSACLFHCEKKEEESGSVVVFLFFIPAHTQLSFVSVGLRGGLVTVLSSSEPYGHPEWSAPERERESFCVV